MIKKSKLLSIKRIDRRDVFTLLLFPVLNILVNCYKINNSNSYKTNTRFRFSYRINIHCQINFVGGFYVGVNVSLLFIFLFYVFFICFVFVLCLVLNVASISGLSILDCFFGFLSCLFTKHMSLATLNLISTTIPVFYHVYLAICPTGKYDTVKQHILH